MEKYFKVLCTQAICSGVSIFLKLPQRVASMLEVVFSNEQYLGISLLLGGVIGWGIFVIISHLFSYNKSEYSKYIGFLYNDVIENWKQGGINHLFTKGKPRAYISYWKLDNLQKSLPNNGASKKLKEFLEMFTVRRKPLGAGLGDAFYHIKYFKDEKPTDKEIEKMKSMADALKRCL